MLKESSTVVLENENFIAEPPTKGVSTETMGLVNSGALVKRIFEGASPWAFVREFIQNSIDANATRIEIGPDFVGVKTAIEMGQTPVYKLCFADNGDGIPRNKMKTLLNNLSSSGRNMGADANFGIGAKVAALPWNPYGIVFMSWPQDGQEGMVRLFRRTDGNYGLFRFNESDDDTERFTDLTTPPEAYRQPFQKESGTTVVLLGSEANEDTVFGPPDQQAGLYAMIQLINDRYFKFPDKTEVWVTMFDTVTKSKWPKNRSEAKRLKAYGAYHYLDKYSDDCGVVKIDGAKVHWWWHKDWTGDQGNPSTQLFSAPGYVGALYNNELYDVMRKVKYSREKSKSNLGLVSMYAKFGILWQDVWKNITLIVEPDQYSEKNPEGVMPDLSRGRLKMANGEELPWDDWGKQFAEKMPDVILKAIEEASEGNVEVVDLESKLKEYLDRMDLYSGPDDQASPRNKSPVPRRGAAKTRNTGDGDSGERRPTKYNLPAIEWVKPKNMSSVDDLFNGKAVFYSEANNCLMFNDDFPLWKSMISHWVGKYPKNIPGLTAKVREAVRYVYSSTVVSRVVHIRRFRGHRDWGSAAVNVALSNESLTMAVLGIQDADIRIAAHLKGSVKTKRVDVSE